MLDPTGHSGRRPSLEGWDQTTSEEVIVNWFRLKACVKCGGDLVLDEGDWLCLQCATYYYTGLYPGQHLLEWPPLRPSASDGPPSPRPYPGEAKAWVSFWRAEPPMRHWFAPAGAVVKQAWTRFYPWDVALW